MSCVLSCFVVLGLAVAWAPRARAEGTRAVTIEDSVNLRGVSGAKISPDGTRVLFTVRAWEWPDAKESKPDPDKTTDGAKSADAGKKPGDATDKEKPAKAPEMRSHIWLVPADGSEPARQITFGERGESSPAWSPDGRFIAFTAVRGAGASAPADGDGGPKPQIWIMPANGGEAQQLTDAKEGAGAFEWSPDSTRIAYTARDPLPKDEDAARKRKDDERVFEDDRQRTHLWVIDVATKTAAQITSGADFSASSPSWSPDGTRVAFVSRKSALVRDERSDIAIVTLATKAVEPIAATTALETSPKWSPDGKTIAYAMVPFGDARTNADGLFTRPLYHGHLMLYDVAGKQARDASDPSFDRSVSSVTWLPDSTAVLFSTGERASYAVFRYDLAARRYRALTHDGMTFVDSVSKDGTKAAFTRETATAPTDVFVSGVDFASPRKLSTVNPQAADFALGEAEVITWQSDGGPVEGVLVKPVGYQPGKKYPLLVDVHGGPTGAHTNGFKVGVHNGAQLWAGQGWAVLYPNPRGSTGYGEQFMRANIRDWGGGDYRDIMAGVDEVIKRGVADPDKLALMGWSYGGYMTCWMVTQTGRFKAARMGAGLSDLYSMYGTTDIPGYIGTFFDNYPGEKTLQLYRERSGMTYVDRVTTPLLILHGQNDERVPIGQPMQFYRALKDRGKTVELVFYPREGHGFSEYYHQRDQIRRELEWMTKYVLGKTQSTAP